VNGKKINKKNSRLIVVKENNQRTRKTTKKKINKWGKTKMSNKEGK
jgi:hypothetical protein